jgi:amidase
LGSGDHLRTDARPVVARHQHKDAVEGQTFPRQPASPAAGSHFPAGSGRLGEVSEPLDLDLCGQAGLLARGELPAFELISAAIDRLTAGAELNVLVDEQFDSALERARALDATPRRERPALAGVPFLLKDLGEPQAGRPERMGSVALADHVAERTAASVSAYEAAGLIVCGRTSTPEFGNHCATEPALTGPTLNPWDRAISPGGSSGGSAAAVAARMVPAASGGDGTGSIRMPASCCGLVGLKPRRGRVSLAPGSVALDGLAVKGALTRSVRDSAALLDVVAGGSPGDPYTAPKAPGRFLDAVGADPGPVRILSAERPPFGVVDREVQAIADRAAAALAGLGHHLSTGAADFDAESLRRSISVIHAVDNAATVRWVTRWLGRPPHEDALDPVTWDMAREGERLSAVDHLAAVDAMYEQSRRAAAIFAAADVVLCPTLNRVGMAPGVLSASRGSVDAFFDVEFSITGWTALVNATGWAAISLPIGEVRGWPVGVQLIAPDETVLLSLAAQLEIALPWGDRRPPVPAR